MKKDMDKEFLNNWEKSYAKMLKEARHRVFQEEQIYARPYITEKVYNPTTIQKILRNLEKIVFRLDDERIKKAVKH